MNQRKHLFASINIQVLDLIFPTDTSKHIPPHLPCFKAHKTPGSSGSRPHVGSRKAPAPNPRQCTSSGRWRLPPRESAFSMDALASPPSLSRDVSVKLAFQIRVCSLAFAIFIYTIRGRARARTPVGVQSSEAKRARGTHTSGRVIEVPWAYARGGPLCAAHCLVLLSRTGALCCCACRSYGLTCGRLTTSTQSHPSISQRVMACTRLSASQE